MKNLADRLNMKFGEVDGAYIMRDNDASAAICALTNGNYTGDDYDAAVIILDDFASSANDDTGHVVSVWLDEDE